MLHIVYVHTLQTEQTVHTMHISLSVRLCIWFLADGASATCHRLSFAVLLGCSSCMATWLAGSDERRVVLAINRQMYLSLPCLLIERRKGFSLSPHVRCSASIACRSRSTQASAGCPLIACLARRTCPSRSKSAQSHRALRSMPHARASSRGHLAHQIARHMSAAAKQYRGALQNTQAMRRSSQASPGIYAWLHRARA